MRVIIAGSRTINDPSLLTAAVHDSGFNIDCVVSGGANGVDSMAIEFAKHRIVPCLIFYAEWDKYGKSAGPIRNKRMAEEADALILIWDGKSKGSKNMKETAQAHGLKIHELVVDM